MPRKTDSPLPTQTESPFTFSNGDRTDQFEIREEGPSIRTLGHDHNIDQKLITVTEDKTLICLRRNLRNLGTKRWVHPLSLLLSLLVALATSDFDKLSWLNSELLRATFIVSASITAGWLIWEVVNASKMKDITDAISDIFQDLRGEPLHNRITRSFFPWGRTSGFRTAESHS